MTSKIIAVVDGVYGSASKGHVAAGLAAELDNVAVVRVAGPNAGHSAIGVLDGVKYAMCQIPVAAVSNLKAAMYIAAGSEIDPNVLTRELDLLDGAGYKVSERLVIDGSATYMGPEYALSEQADKMWERLGSTAHGIGAARSARIMRTAKTWRQAVDENLDGLGDRFASNTVENTEIELMAGLRRGMDVMIEGTQGYGLGLHTAHYPKTTSSDCRTIDFLAMVGLAPWGLPDTVVEPWVVVRTYPIRVAGNSGYMKDETSWEQLGLETGGYIQPEITTVTKRIRRVGRWDGDLVRQAIEANGGPGVCKVALAFVDYLQPSLANSEDFGDINTETLNTVRQMTKDMGVAPSWLGTGPGTHIDMRGREHLLAY